MDFGQQIMVSYFLSIPLSVFALFFMPRRGTLNPYMENLRRNGAIFGLLPCAWFSVLMLAISTGIYYFRVQSIITKERGALAEWNTGSTSDSGNPFSSRDQQSTLPAVSGNPFGDVGTNSAPTMPHQGDGNPFAPNDRSASPGAPAPGSNPFSTGSSENGNDSPRANPFA